MKHYEIRVVGHLDQSRARALGVSRLRLLPDGSSLFVISAVDAAALYGLLSRLRDGALELLAVTRLEPVASNGDATTEGSDRP